MPLTREALARAAGGRVVQGAAGPPLRAVFTDTRRPVPGGLFVALQGPHFDAHDFLPAALRGGAAGCVVAAPARVPVTRPRTCWSSRSPTRSPRSRGWPAT